MVRRDAREPSRPARRGFGHTQDRTGIVEEEAAVIREAAHRVLGGETLSSIVQEWNRRGVRTAGGGPWRVNSLSSILVQPRLAGLAVDAPAGGAPSFPPIIDADTHTALVALHASRRKGPRRTTRRYLLTGLLRCWRCGGGLRGMPRARGADLYVCPGPPHGGCSGTAVTADHADEAILAMVLTRLDSRDFLGTLKARGAPAARHRAEVTDNAGRLATNRGKLADLADMWAAGDISREEWVSLKRNLGDRAQAAQAELTRLDRLDALRGMAGTGRAIGAAWPTMTVDQRRLVMHTVIDHVVVLQAEPPRQVFRPERLQMVWMG
ncbi:MAG: recombinase family protein [Actinomycetota bacterium]|nr:recombinase family protein [Actinomycetota bacterium]